MADPVAGRRYDAALHLLDRQVVDMDGRLVGKVDDLELQIDASGALKVAALLQGPGALGPRFGGRLGGWILAVWKRLHNEVVPTPRRIPMSDVVAIDSVVHIGRSVEKSEGELWVETYVVGRIPGRWA
ncbi:MAG: hypothetical protein ACJ73L_08810 [Actinomycetes bacterium]|jgi:sporulation protein YlmC with PRC-barrel domain